MSSVVVRYSTAHIKLSLHTGSVSYVREREKFAQVNCGFMVSLSNAMRGKHPLSVSNTRYGAGKFSKISCGGRDVNVYCVNKLSIGKHPTSAQARTRGGSLHSLITGLYGRCSVVRLLKRHSASPSLSSDNRIRPKRCVGDYPYFSIQDRFGGFLHGAVIGP